MGTNKKIETEFLKICRYTFFKYLKKGIRKKIALGFFEIFKDTFFNIWKSGQAKKCFKIS